MKKTASLLLVVAAAAVSGCASEAGRTELTGTVGQALAKNNMMQDAYASAVLSDLAVAFRAAVPDTVNFEFDSSRLTPEARAALDQQAAWLKANQGVRMTVVGHTDLVGSERYNRGLGLRRARTTVNYLVSQGVGRDRLDAVESRGESQPVVPTTDREVRNRRTVTQVAGLARGYVGHGMDGRIAARIFGNHLRGTQGTDTEVATGL